MKKMRRLMFLAVAIALVVTPSLLTASDRVRMGQWEVTSTSNGKARTFKSCVQADEATAVNGDAKASKAYTEKLLAGHCTFTDYKVSGNSISSVMSCGATIVRSTTTYHGDRYESDSTTRTGNASEVTSHIDAKRLGDCP